MFNLLWRRRSHLVRADARRLHVPAVRRTRRLRAAVLLLRSLPAQAQAHVADAEITVSVGTLLKTTDLVCDFHLVYYYISFILFEKKYR